eukprot:gene15099-biopygen3666
MNSNWVALPQVQLLAALPHGGIAWSFFCPRQAYESTAPAERAPRDHPRLHHRGAANGGLYSSVPAPRARASGAGAAQMRRRGCWGMPGGGLNRGDEWRGEVDCVLRSDREVALEAEVTCQPRDSVPGEGKPRLESGRSGKKPSQPGKKPSQSGKIRPSLKSGNGRTESRRKKTVPVRKKTS